MNHARVDASRITLRRAVREDAPGIGAVFDAAVRAGWTYLGDLTAEPMFTPADWDQLVTDHLPPNVLVVAVDETQGIVGYTAVHPEDGEMFLLYVHEQNERAVAVYTAAGYRPDGPGRVSDFRGTRVRELRLVKQDVSLQIM